VERLSWCPSILALLWHTLNSTIQCSCKPIKYFCEAHCAGLSPWFAPVRGGGGGLHFALVRRVARSASSRTVPLQYSSSDRRYAAKSGPCCGVALITGCRGGLGCNFSLFGLTRCVLGQRRQVACWAFALKVRATVAKR
jgi:hypothetical protein